jgi:glycosyltransferase involved in cell wall biosynthesis
VNETPIPKLYRNLRQKFRLASLRGLAERPDHFSKGRPLIAGFLSSPIGLGEGARVLIQGLNRLGLEPSVFDLTPDIQPGRSNFKVSAASPDDSKGPIILHVNPPEVPLALKILQRRFNLKNRMIIGVWAWELTRAPPEWDYAARWFDEIWASSLFIHKIFDGHLSTPVAYTGYPCKTSDPPKSNWRERLDLKQDFTVLTAFDPRSSFSRKNPEGAIRAFLKAFANRTNVRLVVKFSKSSEPFPETIKPLLESRQVVVVDYSIEPEEMRALIGTCDCMISLHRAEGYGLVPAQASAMGIPAIVTAWSSVSEFLDCPNIFGVDYKLTEIVDPQGLYSSELGQWAEPDIDDAAKKLRIIEELPEDKRRVLAATSMQWWNKNFDDKAFWERLPARTKALMSSATDDSDI